MERDKMAHVWGRVGSWHGDGGGFNLAGLSLDLWTIIDVPSTRSKVSRLCQLGSFMEVYEYIIFKITEDE